MGQTSNTDVDLYANLTALRRQVNILKPLSARAAAAENELDVFFTQSIDLLCIASLDGYFKRLNPAWIKQLGWTQQELLATPFIDFVHPDDREATIAEVGTLGEGNETIHFENRYRHKDDSYHWLQWNARSMPGRQLLYATARDVTQQKQMEQEIIEIADHERERLSRELHDGLCQSLAGIAALSAALSRKLQVTSDTDKAARAREITELVNETIGDVRGMARGLGPIRLGASGLYPALQTLTDNVEHMFRIPCSLVSDQTIPRLDRNVETHLFRIAQQALNNAVTHSRATRIDISLSSKDGNGLLCVRDDGIGFPDPACHAGGIGLHTMAYRARQIGATLDMRSRTVQGAAVSCSFPLSARLADEPVAQNNVCDV